MKRMASLSGSLLSMKGRGSPAKLIDKLVSDLGGVARAPESGRWEAAEQMRNDYQRPLTAVPPRVAPAVSNTPVVVSLPAAGNNIDRRVASTSFRRKLSVRIDSSRHMKLKLAAIHLGMTAQELITRALDRYLESVPPELAQTLSLVAAGETPRMVRTGGSETKDLFALAPEVEPTS